MQPERQADVVTQLPTITQELPKPKGLIIQFQLLGLDGTRRFPYSPPPYTSMMDDVTIIIGDMVADAEARWHSLSTARFKAGQLPAEGPLAQQTPLVPPERGSGSLLDTSS